MILVTENGLTLAGPLLSMVAWVVSMLITPPMPLPSMRPTLSGRWFSSSHAPASSSASLAEARAIWANRSVRAASLRSMKSPASKSVHSAAILTSKPSGSKCVIRLAPLSHASSELQNRLRPIPTGLTTPTPVM
jgi:hypothetical protein